MHNSHKAPRTTHAAKRFFLPYQIDTDFVISALAASEVRPGRILERADEQMQKRESLKITGKLMPRSTMRSHEGRKSNVVDCLLRDEANRDNSTQPHPSEPTCLQQYEKMVVNNPLLYRKLIGANNTKHSLTKQSLSSNIPLSNQNTIPNHLSNQIDINNTPSTMTNSLTNSKNIDNNLKNQRNTETNRRNNSNRQSQYEGVKTIAKGSRDLVLMPQEQKRLTNQLLYRQFLFTVQCSNKEMIIPPKEETYKAFICKGNNGILVKSILKTRPWWSIRSYSELDSCHLVWTQWKRTAFTNQLPSHVPTLGNPSIPNNPHSNANLNNYLTTNVSNVKQTKQQYYDQKLNMIRKIAPLEETLFKKVCRGTQTYYPFTVNLYENRPQAADRMSREMGLQLRNSTKQGCKMTNHIPGCLQLHSKRLLFMNLLRYYRAMNKDIFEVIPHTFLIRQGSDDPQFSRFLQAQGKVERKAVESKAVWICKPGENSNRGNGICVYASIEEIRRHVNSRCAMGRSVILQKYIQNPYLYNRRKFDIRCYMLVTTVHGVVKGYFYNEGYVRTTSAVYSLKHLDNKLVHLTNDAIQKKGEQYGKYESCNKVSFADFEKYLQLNREQVLFADIVCQLRAIAKHLLYATASKLNPLFREYTFELFGLDYMLDDKLQPFLIQANSNPCLEVDGNVLARIIPTMLEQTIRIAIDPVFPPPYSEHPKTTKYAVGNSFHQNKYQIIYDSLYDYPLIPNDDAQDEQLEEDDIPSDDL